MPGGFSGRQSELSGEPGKVLGPVAGWGNWASSAALLTAHFKRMAELSTLLGEQAQLPETESHARLVAGS